MSATSACSRGPDSTTSTGFCNRGPDTPHPTGCVTGWEARIRAPSSPRSPSRETIRCAWRRSTVSSRSTAARPATSRSRPWPRGEWWWVAALRPGSARGWPAVVSSRPFSPRDASRNSCRPCPSRSPSILGRRYGVPRVWRGSWPGHERRRRFSTKAVREAGRPDMSDPPQDVQSQTWTLPADLEAAVKAEIEAWQEAGKVRRLWERDASLWTGTDEASWLGWLELPTEEIAQLAHLKRAQEDARTGGFDHVLLLGMGGSSLCPEVLRMTFGRVAGFPELHVLDSTDPAQIRAVERRLDPAKTLFIVSGKYCSTLEQLLAESTGKESKGIVPVDREPSGDIAIYGADRLFVYLRLEPTPDLHQDERVAALERAGYPVVRIRVGHRYDLGQEFFRWGFATAVAGAIIGINAFNQPDVEASKIATRKLTEQYERTGMLAPEAPMLEGDGLKLYADERNAAQLMAVPGARTSIVGALRAHFERLRRGNYATFLAYIEMSEAHEEILQAMRRMVRDGKHVATCLGFGPRFLHSTGQAYKGGPNSGVFLQITCDDAADLAVPGQKLTFGVVKAAQARGDFQVLAERQRRALRVHLGKDVAAGLETVRRSVEQALA